MSLGLPGQIIEIEGEVALVDFWGTRKRVRIGTLDVTVMAGDYIIEHEGSAIRRIPVEEVADTLGMYEVVLCEAGEDPVARDAAAELAAEEELEVV